MEPFNDDELRNLLRTWQAPAAPEYLHPPAPHQPWYVAFWAMSVRIPAPVLALLLIAVIALQVLTQRDRPQIPPDALREIRLADFTPVSEAKPVVVRRTPYENR